MVLQFDGEGVNGGALRANYLHDPFIQLHDLPACLLFQLLIGRIWKILQHYRYLFNQQNYSPTVFVEQGQIVET